MDLRETKIYTAGKSKELQEKLFEMGYTWVNKYKELNTDENIVFIYIDNIGIMSYGDDINIFKRFTYKQVKAQDVLDYEIPKKDWKDELQEGEYLINALLNKNPLVDCTPAHKGVEFFNDKNKAIRTIKVLKLHLEMLRFAELRNGDWKPMFNETETVPKYGLLFKIDILIVGGDKYENRFVFNVCFKTLKIAEEALEIFGDRIRELYLKS